MLLICAIVWPKFNIFTTPMTVWFRSFGSIRVKIRCFTLTCAVTAGTGDFVPFKK